MMRFLPKFLRKAFRKGRLTVVGPDGAAETFGSEPGPSVTMRLHDPALDWKMFFNPEMQTAEAYMDGRLTIDEGGAYALLELVFLNKRHVDMTPSQIFWNSLNRRARRLLQHNPVARASQNVKHHYDLGNTLYRAFLDRDMQYSCGYFPEGRETLEAAQTLKKRHIAAKLALAPGQKVLDIGCGWGGMALYLALVGDVDVTGVTLSEEQLAVANARAAHLGLADRVRFRLCDYREVSERFDRVVSVGMLEHVGVSHLGEYFLNARDRLAPDGVALIHSISSMTPPGQTGAFLRKYIFPGGYAPSLSETALRVERSGLWILDCEIWRLHYARTLRLWRERFLDQRDEMTALYDQKFTRMWEFYLAACEGAFRYGASNVIQLQLARQRDAVPLHRDYIAEASARLAAREAEALPRLLASADAAFAPSMAPSETG